MRTDTSISTVPPVLNRSTSAAWRTSAMSRWSSSTPTLDLDMSATTVVDSNGLAALFSLQQEVQKQGGRVRILNPTRQVTQLLEVTRLHRSVEIVMSPEAPIKPAQQRPILVVEDEPHIRSVAELSMRPLGRVVMSAENGQEAINIARREQPAVIILDYLMPVMDGVATLNRLKEDEATRHIPVIIMSASEHVVCGKDSLFNGASFVMKKPFSPAALRNEVQRLMQQEPETSAV